MVLQFQSGDRDSEHYESAASSSKKISSSRVPSEASPEKVSLSRYIYCDYVMRLRIQHSSIFILLSAYSTEPPSNEAQRNGRCGHKMRAWDDHSYCRKCRSDVTGKYYCYNFSLWTEIRTIKMYLNHLGISCVLQRLQKNRVNSCLTLLEPCFTLVIIRLFILNETLTDCEESHRYVPGDGHQ